VNAPIFYFDIDGFLARFTEGASRAHGRPTDETIIWKSWHHWRTWGKEDEALYAVCNREFWANLPPWEDGMQLLRLVESRVGTSRIVFITSPARTPGTGQGKREWVAKHLPQYDPWADVMIGGAKHKLAGPGKVLLDDSDDNCRKFVEHGGEAIVIPRPWNGRADLCDERGQFHVGMLYDSLGGFLS
jgi:hypothetical protein